MGSKARLAKHYIPLFNKIIRDKNINTYIEPFVGGANIIEGIECENRIGNDINEYLIALWKAIQNGWIPPKNISKEEYIDIRDNMNKYPKELVAAVGLCATYNTKWFGGMLEK
jgi:Site-specific DNA methylase